MPAKSPDVCRYELRFVNPFGIASYTRTTHTVLLARWEHNGITAYGESSHYYNETPESAIKAFARCTDLVEGGLDDIMDSRRDLERRLPDNPSVRALISMLWYDYVGKRDKIPLSTMLGFIGMKSTGTTTNIDRTRAANSSFTIGLDSIDEMLRKAEEAAPNFDALKIKLGTSREHDFEVMKQLRRLLPHKKLRVDANGAWTPEVAMEAIKVLGGLGVELIEQPLTAGNVEQLKEITAEAPMPIFVDEDCRTLDHVALFAGVVDGIVVKLMKCGGLTRALQMIQLARERELRVMLGCMIETSVGITAAANLAPLADFNDLDGSILVANDPFEGASLGPRGQIRIPVDHGIGANPLDPNLDWQPVEAVAARLGS